MKKSFLHFILLIIISLSISTSFAAEFTKAKPLARGVRFVENKGQWETPVLFRADVPMGSIFLEKNTLTYVLVDPYRLTTCHHPDHCLDEHGEKDPDHDIIKCHAFKVRFKGSNPAAIPSGKRTYTEYYNFFHGNDPTRWAHDVPLFHEVRYPDMYPGTDLLITHSDVHLKYEFILSPGASANNILLEYQGTDGMRIDEGRLMIQTSVNEVIEQQPFAYQIVDGDTVSIGCHYVLKGNLVSFAIDQAYRKDLPLVIDPVVVASTYAGSMGNSTYGHSATYDSDGNIYTGGRSFGTGYPTTTGAYQVSFAGGSTDIAISKFNATGTTLMWATYIGGSSDEYSQSLVTNDAHDLFIYGSTQSANYPVTSGCFQPVKSGGYDIFITRLNSSGNALVASTFIGGSASDGQNNLITNYGDGYRGEIILDSQGNPCVSSMSSSNNFPTTLGAFDRTHNGMQDGVVFKFNAALTSLIWSTYLGGSNNDAAYGLKLNVVDMVYVAGGTQSTNFPTTTWVMNPTYLGGSHDGFMCIFMPDMTSMIAGSFFGTPAFDEIFFIQMDNDNNVYIYGQTAGSIPVTPGCFGNPGSHQFIVKLDQTLNGIIYSTVFGNGTHTGWLVPTAFLVDFCQNVYAAGWGKTTGYPTTPDAAQLTTDGDDFYLLVLKKDAEELLYATFFGSPSTWEHVDGGTSRFDKNGIIYEAVCEGASNFPTTPGAYASSSSVGWDLSVFKIDFQLSGPLSQIAMVQGNTGCAPYTVNFLNTSTNANEYLWNFGDGSPTSASATPTHVFTTPGSYTISCIAIDSTSCFISDTAFLSITILAPPVVNLGPDTIACGIDTLILDAGNMGSTFLWSTNAITQKLAVTTPGIYWVQVNNGFCTKRDSIMVAFMQKPNIGPDISVCENIPVTLNANMPGFQYLWNTGQTTQTITADSTQPYWVGVTQGFCTLYDTVLVTLKPLPIVNLGPDQAICQGQSTILDAGHPGAFYTWNTGFFTQQITVAATGSYWVQVTLDGCSGSDTIQVNVLPVPIVNLNGDRILCEGDTLTLNAGNPGYDYLWNTGETSQTILISDSGYYSVTVSAAGCSGRDTIHASMIVLRVDLGNDTLLCPGQTLLLDAGNPGCTYYWNTGDTVRARNIKNNGIYWVRVMKYLCSASDTIHIDVMRNLNLPEMLNVCGYEFLTIDAGIQAEAFEWSTGEITPSIQVTEAGIYSLLATKGHCLLSDSTLVIGTSGISTFYIPNAFSPNADGKNDRFLVKGTDIIYFNMKIFNRWGEFLFETSDIYEGWDGSYNGSIVMAGTYFYVIRYANECSFDQVFQKAGTMSVVK